MMTARSLTPPDTPDYWWLNKAVDFATSGARSVAILLRPFTGDLAYSEAAWTSKKPAPDTSTSTPGILAISRLIFYI